MHSNLRKHEQIEKCSKSAQNTMEAEWNIETKKHVKVGFFLKTITWQNSCASDRNQNMLKICGQFYHMIHD